MLILTRLLYSKDEVFNSLTNSMLEAKDIYECYFWLGEIYYSDPKDMWNIFDYIWRLYFDFYAIKNPSLEKYIQKKEKLWKTEKDIDILIHIVYNIFGCESSDKVFILRNYIYDNPKELIIYRVKGKKWSWLDDFPDIYHQFLISLSKKNMINACFQLMLLKNKCASKDLYNVILTYYGCNIALLKKEIIEKKWTSRRWPDELQGFIALILHMETPIEEINHPFVFRKPNSQVKEGMRLHNENIEKRHRECNNVYNILKVSRIYKVHYLNGVFIQDREKYDDFKNECRHNWEYYAHRCPLWKARIESYTFRFSKKILDIDDDFYDHYNLELDEQCRETQNKSLKHIDAITINDWRNHLFESEPIMKLDKRSSLNILLYE